MISQLKLGDSFTFDDFAKHENKVILFKPTYGKNEVRIANKIIDFTGLLIEDVDLIKIDTGGGFVAIDLCNSLGNRICRKLMKRTEMLVVNGFDSSPKYNFVN